MAVYFKLYQNHNEKNTQARNKWYARATHLQTTGTDELADIMQANCTLKRSDIVATIYELVDAMTRELQNGHRVRLNGLGTFKIGISSRGVEQPDDFRPDRDVRDVHVLFHPDTKVNNGVRRRSLLSGTKTRKLKG